MQTPDLKVERGSPCRGRLAENRTWQSGVVMPQDPSLSIAVLQAERLRRRFLLTESLARTVAELAFPMTGRAA